MTTRRNLAKYVAVRNPPSRRVGLAERVAKLLVRKNGATKKEIERITHWAAGVRYCRRLGATRGLIIEELAPYHWRAKQP